MSQTKLKRSAKTTTRGMFYGASRRRGVCQMWLRYSNPVNSDNENGSNCYDNEYIWFINDLIDVIYEKKRLKLGVTYSHINIIGYL